MRRHSPSHFIPAATSLWFLPAPQLLSLLETAVPLLSSKHPSIAPCSWEALPPCCHGQRPRLPLSAFHTLTTVSCLGMGM